MVLSAATAKPAGNALPWLALSAAIIVLDQLTKTIVLAHLEPYVPNPVIPGVLNWTLAFNTGAAFSFLADAGGWQRWGFAALAVAICSALVVWLARTPRGDWRTALPLGLILNEAITNALKYAFPGGRDGRIRIVLEEATHGELRLTVEDNGIGLPPGFDLETHSSMGLHLIKMMSEQLNGTFDIHSNGGTVLTICFHNMKTTGGPTTLRTAN